MDDSNIPVNNDIIISYDPLDLNSLDTDISPSNRATVHNVCVGMQTSGASGKPEVKTKVNNPRKRRNCNTPTGETINNPKTRKTNVVRSTVVKSGRKVPTRPTVNFSHGHLNEGSKSNSSVGNKPCTVGSSEYYDFSSALNNEQNDSVYDYEHDYDRDIYLDCDPSTFTEMRNNNPSTTSSYSNCRPNDNSVVLLNRQEYQDMKNEMAAMKNFLQANIPIVQEVKNDRRTGAPTELHDTSNEPIIDLVDPESMYDEFLKEFEDPDEFDIPKIFQGDDLFAKPAKDSILNLVNVATSKRVEIGKMASKYPLPVNCKRLVPPLMDGDVWSVLPKQAQAQDSSLQDVQKLIGLSIVPLLPLLSLSDKQEVKNNVVDSIVTMGNAMLELSFRRRIFLKRFLSKRYHTLCSTSRPVDETLFGPDVATRMRDIDQSNRLYSNLNNNSNRNYRFNNRRSFLGQGSVGRSRGRFRSRGRSRGRYSRGQNYQHPQTTTQPQQSA
ncbi:hypothetical protein LOTGIDRAFT_163769 [Lottia gigantea]|uniref:Uncharacterized protein n=1 Tax=Lottia gigantea TaxID=225164 RepID=V4A7B3_LOTGI|nr:hypothetical protein LOTGIDRAFT_163769 [Lottia gigantea]ESO90880.1 hypothetical protein LOTGIDRAFT_163769 [Lottia gigantea]